MSELLDRMWRWTRLSRFDLVFSLYAAGAAAVLVILSSWFVPEVDDRCDMVEGRTLIYGCNFEVGMNTEWLYWAALFAIPVFLLFIAVRPVLIRNFTNPVGKGIATAALFLLASLISIPLAGFPGVLQLTYHSWLLYGLVLGTIDAVSAMSIDLSFVSSSEYDRTAKIARLQQEHHQWTSALVVVTAIYIAIAISGLLTLFIGVNEILRVPWSNMGLPILLYGTVGLAVGVYGNILRKISSIRRAILEV